VSPTALVLVILALWVVFGMLGAVLHVAACATDPRADRNTARPRVRPAPLHALRLAAGPLTSVGCRDAPDAVAHVIGDEQGATAVDGNSGRTAPCIARRIEKATEDIDWLPLRASPNEPHKQARMNSGIVDDGVWGEARSRAEIVARTLPDAPAINAFR
jgi:hypothetical protein